MHMSGCIFFYPVRYNTLIMIVDGKQIAEEMRTNVKATITHQKRDLRLAIVVVGEVEVIEKFVAMKKRFGESVGVDVAIHRFAGDISKEELKDGISDIIRDDANSAVVIQLPLPEHIPVQEILNMVPPEKDVDALSREAMAGLRRLDLIILPPVVGAIKEIVDRNKFAPKDLDVLVLGHGRLVGAPAALWFRHKGAHVTVLDKPVKDLSEFTRDADVIVLGVGSPGILKPDMIKEGVVILDAGTSEEGGKLFGDADPACAEKSLIFTPVPGGIGPITVAMIFRNMTLISGSSRGEDGVSFALT